MPKVRGPEKTVGGYSSIDIEVRATRLAEITSRLYSIDRTVWRDHDDEVLLRRAHRCLSYISSAPASRVYVVRLL